MKIPIMMLALAATATARAEVSCYRTPAQAAVQVGQQDGGGYRLETIHRDELAGKNWATVRSCVHPNWPGVMVLTALTPNLNQDKAAAQTGHPTALPEMVMVNGAAVRVVMLDGMARIELSGIAQGSGRIGDRVWVRIAPPVEGTEGRLAQAVVRSAEILEIGQ